jgi:ATP-dependent helicase/nuclease subunit A
MSAAPRPSPSACILDASAGTGKTTQLVSRIVAAMASGVRPENIVAVTFTNAAAGEMKLRVRQKLEEDLINSSDETRTHLQTALSELERSFIGTIHSFCAHLLRQRPVEARVDPSFEELAAPERVFARVFRDWLDERLRYDSPVLRRCFARLARLEERSPVAPIDKLRYEAWKLAEWRDHYGAWRRHEFQRFAKIEEALNRIDTFLQIRNRCDRKERDPLYQSFQPLADFAGRVEKSRATGDSDYDTWEADLLSIPRDHKWLKKGFGPYSQELSREQVLSAWEDLRSYIDAARREIDADFAVDLREELWQVLDRYEQAKHRAGQLDFLDLLLCARRLLDNETAREYFRARYPYVFIDEFQDTDPVQAEVLSRIWTHPVIAGDRKQSIYRFRRADVQQYQNICTDLTKLGAATEQLANCSRSTTPIQAFVNAAFAGMPDYLPLRGGREPKAGQPNILALPMPKPYGSRNLSKARINECSPSTVAAFIEWLVGKSNYQVWDKEKRQYRKVQAGDVCILFRRFSNNGVDLTQDYVRSLEARGIAHVLIGSKSFHQREEVASIRTALRAIEWPEDELSLYATLRSFFGVLDSTLFLYREQHKRRLLYFSDPPSEPEFERIAFAFDLLRELHNRRNTRPIAQTIHELLASLRAFTTFAFRKGGKRVLANVYRLLDIARSFELTEATSFRSFIEYLEEQSEGGEAKEAPILEQESDAVKLINVHKAKGLEWPVVILADLTANLVSPEGSGRWIDSEQKLCAQRLLGCAPQDLLDNMDKEDRAEREEAVRLAYVAATRARDLLVVSAVGDISFVKKQEFFEASWLFPLYPSLYPSEDRWRVGRGVSVLEAPPECGDNMFLAPGTHYGREGGSEVVWFDPKLLNLSLVSDGGIEKESLLKGTDPAGVQRYRDWQALRKARIESGSRPAFHVIEATKARGLKLPEPTSILVPMPRQVSNARRFGRLVHKLMEAVTLPLQTEALRVLADYHVRGHGCTTGDAEMATNVVLSLFGHDLLRTAASAQVSYRELPISVKLDDGRLVEGRADLVYFDGESWTVVDYKTGETGSDEKRQVALYAHALQIAKKQPVRAIILEI